MRTVSVNLVLPEDLIDRAKAITDALNEVSVTDGTLADFIGFCLMDFVSKTDAAYEQIERREPCLVH